jgi:hypothetical protein
MQVMESHHMGGYFEWAIYSAVVNGYWVNKACWLGQNTQAIRHADQTGSIQEVVGKLGWGEHEFVLELI